ncbi:uncharacterized protein LOC125037997 [Penaeus chinensis]|uniref:uncharacterized protein LOC125037997 n=1 Tax=Penaeus chinensis TaxID=139456 RepID=UPI001FB7E86D|nr:uncharacterized protein LOC125037997 [Penaeus chinensis]
MRHLIVLSVLAVSGYAAPQGYSLPHPSRAGFTTRPSSQIGEGLTTGSGISSDSTGQSFLSGTASGLSLITGQASSSGISVPSGASVPGISLETNAALGVGNNAGSGVDSIIVCKEGEILHVDGTCVVPEVSRKVFVFDVPQQEQLTGPPPSVPPPKVDHNILFVRLPEEGLGPEPIVVPPPRQNNIVYVLNKQGEQSQRVIEVPAPPPSEPEIYFVNYEEGENPTLPGGVDLHTALGSAAETGGEVIGTIDDAGVTSVGGNTGLHRGVGVGIEIGGSRGGGTGLVGNIVGGRGQVGSGAVGIAVEATNDGNIGVTQGNQNTPSGLYSTP